MFSRYRYILVQWKSFYIIFAGNFSTVGQVSCSVCPEGYYTTTNGSEQCNACPIGHYCLNGDEDPKPCPPGTANALQSQTTCLPCSNGKYSAQPGAIECDVCPIGSYCNEPDKLPQPCQAGFSCLEGQTEGTPCPTGY